MDILKPDRLGLQEVAQRGAVGLRRLLPVFLDRVPTLAQPLLICVAILRNDRGHSVGMRDGETEPNRRAVIEDVKRVAPQSEDFSEAIDHLSEMVEGVVELCPI